LNLNLYSFGVSPISMSMKLLGRALILSAMHAIIV
jgi:hypothetical protein